MSMHDKRHPADDIIDRAAVDPSLIDSGEKRHIESCPECSLKITRIISGLENLGTIAKEAVPPMTSSIRLEHRTSHGISGWLWKTALGVSVSVALVLIVFDFSDIRSPRQYQTLIQAGVQDSYADEMLISEVGMLVENPLPENWTSLDYGDGSIMETEVMEFMAPIDDKPIQETM
jgi:hypothetical protein